MMINKDNVFEKIGSILYDLHDQYEYLAQKKSNVSSVEIDFFIANVIFLHENVQFLKKTHQDSHDFITEDSSKRRLQDNELEQQDEDTHLQETIFEVPQNRLHANFENQTNMVKPEVEAQAVQETVAQASLNEENILNKPISELYATIEEEEEDFEDEVGPEPYLMTTKSIPLENQAINKNETIPTLNDLLYNPHQKNIIDEYQSSVSDLKSLINLNDKLLYIRDLFNGYHLAYAEAIELVNKLPNFEAADAFLQKNYAQINNWEDNPETVQQFYDLLRRRFK